MQVPTYKKDFKFDHVWNLMKDFEKFKDIDTEKRKVQGQGFLALLCNHQTLELLS